MDTNATAYSPVETEEQVELSELVEEKKKLLEKNKSGVLVFIINTMNERIKDGATHGS